MIDLSHVDRHKVIALCDKIAAAIATLDKDDEPAYRTLVVGDLRDAWDLLRGALEIDEYDQQRTKRKRHAA